MISVSTFYPSQGTVLSPLPFSPAASERRRLTLGKVDLALMIEVPGALFLEALPPVRRRRRLQPASRVMARVLAITQLHWFDQAGGPQPSALA